MFSVDGTSPDFASERSLLIIAWHNERSHENGEPNNSQPSFRFEFTAFFRSVALPAVTRLYSMIFSIGRASLPGAKAVVSPIIYMLPWIRLHTPVGWPKAKR